MFLIIYSEHEYESDNSDYEQTDPDKNNEQSGCNHSQNLQQFDTSDDMFLMTKAWK